MDLRVSVCPFVNGEKVVIRILDKTGFPEKLEQMRITEDKVRIFRKWMKNAFGLILASGPTGSGKTTTVYLMLQELAANHGVNVVSIEDPVEYLLPNVQQLQVKNSIGLTFTAGLRSLMRQDPDVVCVGEIRDNETAKLITQVAQTGHLALSQVHSHDAVSTLTLLNELGIPVYTLREMTVGVASQRLVRRLCKHCKIQLTDDEKSQLPPPLNSAQTPLFKPSGCEKCHNTGWRGRAVLFELFEPDNTFWNAMNQGLPAVKLHEYLPNTFKRLRDDGIQLILEGLTTLGEVDRVLG